MVIYFIRHGRQNSTDCNVDVPLSEAGRRQAELLGERMKMYPVAAVYSSNLLRARQTAEIAFSDNRKEHKIRNALRELDFGSLTGKEDKEVKAFYADYYQEQLDFFSQRQKKHIAQDTGYSAEEYLVPLKDMRYPDGENSEMAFQRLAPLVEEWIRSGRESIAVVTHGGIIRTFLSVFFSGSFTRRLQFGTALENCSITQINYDRAKNAFFLERFNDYAHLEAEPALLRKNFLSESS